MLLVARTVLLFHEMDAGMSPSIWADMKDALARALMSYHQKKSKLVLLLWGIPLRNTRIKRSLTNLPITYSVAPTTYQMDLDTAMRSFKIQLGKLWCWGRQIINNPPSGIKAYVHNSWKTVLLRSILYSSFLWLNFKYRIKSKKIFRNFIFRITWDFQSFNFPWNGL